MAAKREIDAIPQERWAALENSTIFFGHQSVGYDLMNGVVDLTRHEPPRSLRVAETSDLSVHRSCFAHAKNGENKFPLSKIRAFEATMRSQSPPPDIAFYKFCYVDITADTDVNSLFAEYKLSMDRLKSDFPSTVFVHVTSPLTTVERGPKAWIKKLLNRPLGGVAHNIRRMEYNQLLLKEYAGREPVFDLALAESTHPDGSRETFVAGGTSYAALIPSYSYDGRHLNERGRQWAAAKLLTVLSEAAALRRPPLSVPATPAPPA